MGAFRFPEGDAAAARVLGIGKTLRKIGYDVHFAGWEERAREKDRCGEEGFSYQGFYYSSQNQFRLKKINPIFRLIKYLTIGVGTLGWLRQYLKTNSVDAVISYHGGAAYLLLLKFFCWKKNIKLIVDCTEWYDANSLPGGKWGVAALESEVRMRFINPSVGQLIVISEFLSNFYKNKKCRVLLMPPTVDLADSKWNVERRISTPELKLVYAGVPGKKDILSLVLLSLDTLREEGHQITIDLVGPSEEEVLACIDGDEKLLRRLQAQIIFHGRVDQSAVPLILKQADFSVLFRPRRRSSDAGFSTKLVESLAVGVPIIANVTGDIAIYIKDGREGVLVNDESGDSILAGIRRALDMKKRGLSEMHVAAKKCAEIYFNYDIYCSRLQEFIEDCR